MAMNVLYLQKLYSKNANPLKGRKLYEQFQRSAEACRLGYIVRPSKDVVEPGFASDVVTYEELDELRPDLVFLEGGLISGNAWRVPQDVIEKLVTTGAVVFICDVNWNTLYQEREQYESVLKFCRVSAAYDGSEPVELYDPKHH